MMLMSRFMNVMTCIDIDAMLYNWYGVDATYKRHDFASTLMQNCINIMMMMM